MLQWRKCKNMIIFNFQSKNSNFAQTGCIFLTFRVVDKVDKVDNTLTLVHV